MKKQLLLFSIAVFSTAAIAQDKAEISVKVVKDGKVVKDTVYTYSDISKAKEAVHVMEMMTNENTPGKHVMKMHQSEMEGKELKHVFVMSDDCEMHTSEGEGMQWVSTTTEISGDSVKIIKLKLQGDEHLTKSGKVMFVDTKDCEEKVFVSEEDGMVQVIVKKIKTDEGSEDIRVRKELILLSEDEDGGGEWTVMEGDDGELIMIGEEGEKIKVIKKTDSSEGGEIVKWSSVEGDEDTQVIIIKKAGEDGEKMEVKVNIEDSEQDVKSKKDKKKTSK